MNDFIFKFLSQNGSETIINSIAFLFCAMVVSQGLLFIWHILQMGFSYWFKKKAGSPVWDRRSHPNGQSEQFTNTLIELMKEHKNALFQITEEQRRLTNCLEIHLTREDDHMKDMKDFFSEMRGTMRDIISK